MFNKGPSYEELIATTYSHIRTYPPAIADTYSPGNTITVTQ